MQRFFARKMRGGWFGVWDMQERVYRFVGDNLRFEESEAAEAEAAKLDEEHAAAVHGAFMLVGVAYWFTKKIAAEYERDFRRWFSKVHGRRLSKPETALGFDAQKGWFVKYTPKEEL